MHQFLKFIIFWKNTLHVSVGLSVHHQESKTVHTAPGICQTDTVACLLAGTRWNSVPSRLSKQQAATEPVRHIPDAVCTALDS